MHSSRMCTARSSSRPGGLHQASPPGPDPPGPGTPLGAGTHPSRHPTGKIPLNFPLGCGHGPDSPNFPLGCGPGPDPPQLPPWLWAWTRSLSTSPLGVGLKNLPGDLLQGMLGYHLQCMLGWHSPCGQTHTCKHITLPQTSFAGGNKKAFQWDAYRPLANRTCFTGHHQMLLLGRGGRWWRGGLQMNKFEQVSNVGHQMLVAGGGSN